MTDKKIKNISCVIIVKNAELTIKNTLDSLEAFDDIVVYSNGCTDSSNEIAKIYSNVNLIQGEFLGFGPTKNKAADLSKYDWILSLDADEVLSENFIKTLKKTALNTNSVYTILRENFYKDFQIKHCWGNDIITRLYNKKMTAFTDKNVHESIVSDGFNVVHFNDPIKHYPYSTITDFIIKLDRYSTLYANDNAGKKKSSPLKAILSAKFAFFKTYFMKIGFLDGYPGLIIAFSHMATTFYKHMKLYEKNKTLK